MKKILSLIMLVSIAISSVNAQAVDNRYSDLTYDYFYGKNSNVSVRVKKVIAGDSKTSIKVLKILATHDKDIVVWLLANKNLRKLQQH